jgi:predicted metal-dependent phosphoesterase TrpH
LFQYLHVSSAPIERVDKPNLQIRRIVPAMLVDMHNHTRISSPDSRLSAVELIELARGRGLDGLCVTEHFFIEGAEIAREVGEKLQFPVFRGIEARTDLGDMLVFGYYRDVPDGIPFQELARMVHEVGGVILAAHPFRPEGFTLQGSLRERGLDLLKHWQSIEILELLDGVEVASGKNSLEANGRAGLLAHRMAVPGIGGSDAHEPDGVGRAVTRFPRAIRSDPELVLALRDGGHEPFLMPAFSRGLLAMDVGGIREPSEIDSTPMKFSRRQGCNDKYRAGKRGYDPFDLRCPSDTGVFP